MSSKNHIVHPIPALYDEYSKVLILGSFPSVKSREQAFFYGHPQNRFWRVLSRVLGEPMPASVEEKSALAHKHGIALWDVIASCDIEGSSDASISNVVVNDLSKIIRTAKLRAIYCNGDKSFSLYEKYTKPMLLAEFEAEIKAGTFSPALLNAVRLPSTSPANAAWSEDALVGAFFRINTALRKSGEGQPYYSLTDYAEDTYHKKMYRLSLDGGFTCPNRDGTIDTRGCIFCDAGGAGDFGGGGYRGNHGNYGNHGNNGGMRRQILPIHEQMENQKALLFPKMPKHKSIGYIAYFQSFTGTYAEVEVLRKKYEEAIANPEIEILSIATRPDCLGKEVLELIAELTKKIPVWVELGLQTKHKKSIAYIRRGYDNKDYETAVKNLLEAGVEQIISHVILGLPGENKKQMLDTVNYVVRCGSTGIKLQLLHVLEDTDLAEDYQNGLFQVLSFEEYVQLTKECVDQLPPDLVVHRLTGDGNKNHLIAPLWSADKKRVINAVNAAIKK